MSAAEYDIEIEKSESFERNYYSGVGSQNNIASFAKATSTAVTVNDNAHGTTDGTRIVIPISENYVGTYTVNNSTTNSFQVDGTFEGTETNSNAVWMHAENLSGSTFVGHIRKNYESTSSVSANFTCATTDAAGGHFKITMSSTVTSALDTGSYYYRVVRVHGDGFREPYLNGKARVKMG